MKLVKLAGGLVTISAVLSFCVTAKAQSNVGNESFSQCVLNLYRISSLTSAATDCLQVFQGKPMNESFSTCVAQLYGGSYSSTAARDYCSKASASSVAQPQPQSPQPTYTAPPSGGNPQAISTCMNAILYQRQPVCTRNGSCAVLSTPEENANNGFGGWQWQTVRTATSESSAAQACQNAR